MIAIATTETDLLAASAGTSGVVALLALVLAAMAFRAARRKGNPQLSWVASAFLVFCGKNVFSAYNVVTHTVPHDAIELILSLADLAILLLLFAPLLASKRRRG